MLAPPFSSYSSASRWLMVIKLNEDGTLDTTFNSARDGMQVEGSASSANFNEIAGSKVLDIDFVINSSYGGIGMHNLRPVGLHVTTTGNIIVAGNQLELNDDVFVVKVNETGSMSEKMGTPLTQVLSTGGIGRFTHLIAIAGFILNDVLNLGVGPVHGMDRLESFDVDDRCRITFKGRSDYFQRNPVPYTLSNTVKTVIGFEGRTAGFPWDPFIMDESFSVKNNPDSTHPEEIGTENQDSGFVGFRAVPYVFK